jgi:DNA adenine methylase
MVQVFLQYSLGQDLEAERTTTNESFAPRQVSEATVRDEGDSVAPFLRWAGSKRWFVPILRKHIPQEFGSYYEPFLGSGSAFFAVAEGHASYLSDTIPGLVNCYVQVRDQPEEVAAIAQSWDTDSATYYEVRAAHAETNLTRNAARFIYLNKLCFNGLYRENGRGQFNVPYGRPKSTNVVSVSNLLGVSTRLRNQVTIDELDFEERLKTSESGDFVYLDPPYVAGHRTNGFADYNAKIFSWDDQRRLAAVFQELDRRGVYVIQTNADHATVRELYDGAFSQPISRYSSMAARSTLRGASSELLIVGDALRRAIAR